MKSAIINIILLTEIQRSRLVVAIRVGITSLILLLLCIKPTIAQDSEFTLNGLSALMASNNIAEEIHFTENKLLRFLNKPLILTGRFYFRSSDFLQKNIDKPFIKVYTLKHNTITFTDKKLESEILTLKDHPLIYASMKAFYTTMSGNFHRLRASYNINLSGTSYKWELVLTPKSKRILKYIKNVTLTGNHTFIERVITNEVNGDSSIIWMKK